MGKSGQEVSMSRVQPATGTLWVGAVTGRVFVSLGGKNHAVLRRGRVAPTAIVSRPGYIVTIDSPSVAKFEGELTDEENILYAKLMLTEAV
jgi:hypothetical protein